MLTILKSDRIVATFGCYKRWSLRESVHKILSRPQQAYRQPNPKCCYPISLKLGTELLLVTLKAIKRSSLKIPKSNVFSI